MVSDEVLGLWSEAKQTIAQVESAAPVVAWVEERRVLSVRDILFLVDNSPALAAATRGCSKA